MQIVSPLLLNVLTLWNSKVSAMALWPFIIFKDLQSRSDPFIQNHEKIHHRQQLELFILPFYIWYFIEYWFYMIKYRMKHDKAYRLVRFEQEAYANEKNLTYLETRPSFAHLKQRYRHDKSRKN